MMKLLLTPLLIILISPIKVFSQPMRIPVIPYHNKNSTVPIKIHNRCKSIVNYSNCVKRYLRVY